MLFVFSVLVIAYAKGGPKLSFSRKRRNENAGKRFDSGFLWVKQLVRIPGCIPLILYKTAGYEWSPTGRRGDH
jgi:hypothetical protein